MMKARGLGDPRAEALDSRRPPEAEKGKAANYPTEPAEGTALLTC